MLAKEINSFSKVILRTFPHIISASIVFVGEDYTRLDFYHLGKRGRMIEVPFGTKNIVEKISNQLNVPAAVALSYLSLFGTDSLDFKIKKQIQTVLNSSENEFLGLWKQSEYFKIDSPYGVFMCVEAPFEGPFLSILQTINPHNKVSVIGPQNELTHLLNTQYSQIL